MVSIGACTCSYACETCVGICSECAECTSALHTLCPNVCSYAAAVRSQCSGVGARLVNLRHLTNVPDPTTNRIIALLAVFICLLLVFTGRVRKYEKQNIECHHE